MKGSIACLLVRGPELDIRCNKYKMLEAANVVAPPVLHKGHLGLGSSRICCSSFMQKDAPAVAASLLALEAAACSLQILSAPGLPSELYQQELLDACLATIKFQLQYNVLVFHDLRYRRLYRQGSLQGGRIMLYLGYRLMHVFIGAAEQLQWTAWQFLHMHGSLNM